MKQTVEEASIKAAEDCYEMPYNENLLHMLLIKQAFELGAEWQAKQSPWISIDVQFPEDKQPVLCSSPIYGKVVLCWDNLSQEWLYPEVNHIYCDWDKVDCWMLIPEV